MSRERGFVLVDGATGYVGNHVVAHLAQGGHSVRCLVRAQAAPPDLDFLRSTGASVVAADLCGDDPQLKGAFSGARAIVHLIGSIAPKKGETLQELHAGQTARVIDLGRQAGVEKVVMVTAVGTGPDAQSKYHATKWESEELLRASGLEYVIVRPSLIIGRSVGRRDSKLIARYRDLISKRALVPLINGGVGRIQPVHVDDLARALVAAVDSSSLLDATIEVGGADIISMRDLVEELMRVMAVHKPVVGLPVACARLAASLCEALQPVPLLSNDQVTMALEDNVCQDNGLAALAGSEPTAWTDALKVYGGDVQARCLPKAGTA